MTFAPVKLMKSRLTQTSVTLHENSWFGFTEKAKVSEVRTSELPPPPSLNTGSVPSANATEQLKPRRATTTKRRTIFTTNPRSNLIDPQQSVLKVQFHRHSLCRNPIATLCNQSLLVAADKTNRAVFSFRHRGVSIANWPGRRN